MPGAQREAGLNVGGVVDDGVRGHSYFCVVLDGDVNRCRRIRQKRLAHPRTFVSKLLKVLVGPAGLEPATDGL